MGTTETKKKRNRRKWLHNGHLLLYSGVKQEKRAVPGVACHIHEKNINQIQKWEACNERILKIEMKDPNERVKTIIIVYGPNDDQLSEIKDRLWEQLNIETHNSRGKIVAFGEDRINNSGMKLINYCSLNDLIATKP